MRAIRDRSLYLGFVLAIAIFGSITIVSYRTTDTLLETTSWTTHTHEVLTEIEGTRSAIEETENGARGYVITGKEQFLGTFSHGEAEARKRIDKVRWLTQDNSRQQRRLDQLALLIVGRLAATNQAIKARKNSGFEAARKRLLEGSAPLIGEIEKQLDAMSSEEKTLLVQRSERAKRAFGTTVLISSLGAVSSIILLGIIF